MSKNYLGKDTLSLLRDEDAWDDQEHRNPKKEAWQSFVNGNEARFKDLFKRYYNEMYGYGLKLCNQPELVKDCIQELFEIIWEKRKDLHHIDSPNVYLFVSLRRRIMKNLKKQRRFQNDWYEIDEDTLLSFSVDEIIVTDEIKHLQKETLLKALNRLSARQREVIWLFFYNGMSYSEIEEILSIKRQSVCNLMYRSMETLRVILNDNETMKLVVGLLMALLFIPIH